MDGETYEQTMVNAELVGEQVAFLQDGMDVTIESYEGELSIVLPDTVVMEIVEADAVVKGQTASSSYKPATLENGVRVMVPLISRPAPRGREDRDSTYGAGPGRPVRLTGTPHPLPPAPGTPSEAPQPLSRRERHDQSGYKAAKGMLRDFGEVEQLQVSMKGPADFISTADTQAERTIVSELKRAPGLRAVTEEDKPVEGTDASRRRWIVDPIDGTTNFLHGIPHFCISIALRNAETLLRGGLRPFERRAL